MKVQNINLHTGNNTFSDKVRPHPPQMAQEYPQISQLSNVYYTSNISFGRTSEEHKSWGAYVHPKTKDVNFKVFTYPDTKAVFVETRKHKDFQEADYDDWANNAVGNGLVGKLKDNVITADNIKSYAEGSKEIIPLRNKGEGVFETRVSSDKVKDGDMYRFIVVRNDGSVIATKDPYSNAQESIFSWSSILDHSKFNWNDDLWQSGKNVNKISRVPYNHKASLKSVGAMNLYEMHIGTINKEGTFEAAKKNVDRAKKLNFNALHIMPVEGTYGNNWGYDGVDKFVADKKYGGPDKLKELIDYAHSKDMNVVLDIVPNHMGSEGNFLQEVGPYMGKGGQWGDGFNNRGDNNKNVRDFLANEALHYARNYHVDGLRLDMTSKMGSDYTMKQIAAELNFHFPDVFLIAEDGREMFRTTQPIDRTSNNVDEHCNHIEDIDSYVNPHNDEWANLGYDSEWSFELHHWLAANLLGAWGFKPGEYTGKSLSALLDVAKNNGNKLKYLMSHDEIGNVDGTKLIHKSIASQMRLGEHRNMEGGSDAERGQRAAVASYEFAKLVATGEIDGMSNEEFNCHTRKLGITRPVDKAEVKMAYKNAVEKHKAGMGFIYTIPGPSMMFQGDESGGLDLFRFFRESYDNESNVKIIQEEKGYSPLEVFESSKVGNIKLSDEGRKLAKGIERYTGDLNKLAGENRALINGYITDNCAVHPSEVMGVHTKSKDSLDELYAITNFKIADNLMHPYGYPSYGIEFPEGKWEMIINSDDKKYGGSGNYVSSEIIDTANCTRENGRAKPYIPIPPSGTVIYKKID